MGLRVNGARVPPTQKGIVATGNVDLSGANMLRVPNTPTADLPSPTGLDGMVAWDTTRLALIAAMDGDWYDLSPVI